MGKGSASNSDSRCPGSATFLAVSGDTALRELRALRDAGLVERGGVGRAAFYQSKRLNN